MAGIIFDVLGGNFLAAVFTTLCLLVCLAFFACQLFQQRGNSPSVDALTKIEPSPVGVEEPAISLMNAKRFSEPPNEQKLEKFANNQLNEGVITSLCRQGMTSSLIPLNESLSKIVSELVTKDSLKASVTSTLSSDSFSNSTSLENLTDTKMEVTEAVMESAAVDCDPDVSSLLQGCAKTVIETAVFSTTIDSTKIAGSEDLKGICDDVPKILEGGKQEKAVSCQDLLEEVIPTPVPEEQPTETLTDTGGCCVESEPQQAELSIGDLLLDNNDPSPDDPPQAETLVVKIQPPSSPDVQPRKVIFIGGQWREVPEEQDHHLESSFDQSHYEDACENSASSSVADEDLSQPEMDLSTSFSDKERDVQSSSSPFDADSSSLSGLSGVSGSSTRTYLGEESTLVLEKIIGGIQKHYLIRGDKSKLKKRGKKLHLFMEHVFVARHLLGGIQCKVCGKSIPLRPPPIKQGYECRNCHLRCHKACHLKVETQCPASRVDEMDLKVTEMGPDGKFHFK